MIRNDKEIHAKEVASWLDVYLVMRRRSRNDGLPARRGIDPECRDRGRECSEWVEALDELLEPSE